MKKVIYSLSGTGVKILRASSVIILILGIITAIAFTILFSYSTDYEPNWSLLFCALTALLFSLFFFGLGKCTAYIAETTAIKRAYLFSKLNEKEIGVYQKSENEETPINQ